MASTEIENPLHRLTDEQIEEIGREFDQLHEEVKADLGDRDARYIRGIIGLQRRLALLGRVLLIGSRYRPLWVGLGIVSAELLLALAVTNRLRNRRVSYRTWRRAHYLNFVIWIAATAHGLGSGTDRGSAWLLGIYLSAIGAVVALTLRRVLRPPSPATRPRGEFLAGS